MLSYIDIPVHTENILSSCIHHEDLYSAPSRWLLRSTPNPTMAEKESFQVSIKRVKGSSTVPKIAHSRERGQPLRRCDSA